MSTSEPGRWAWAEVDPSAIAHNVGVLRRVAEPAAVWVVVKADGYGHGASTVARAAQAAGAAGLCVALVQEGVVLRRAGLAGPILVLSEQPPAQLEALVAHDLVATVYSTEGIGALAAAVAAAGRRAHPVHLKVDTGMHRVGAHPRDAGRLAAEILARAELHLAGVFTHLAVADEPDDPRTGLQLDRFEAVLAELHAAGVDPGVVHAANSAGALAHPRARRDLVRVGIAVYGIEPGPGVAHLCTELRPALSWRARVSFVKRVAAGEGVSYGLRHTFERETTVATVPLGYADGVPRRWSALGGEVLLGGVRRPVVGVVTMDQLMVDCGDDAVHVGDEVVLIGEQAGRHQRAEDWAQRLATIGYEVVCAISPRVPRHEAAPAVGQ